MLLTTSGAAVLAGQRRRFAAVRRREAGQLKEQRRRLCRRPPSGDRRPVSGEEDDVTGTDRDGRHTVHTVLVQSERSDNHREVPGTLLGPLEPALVNPAWSNGNVEVGLGWLRSAVGVGVVPDRAGMSTTHPAIQHDVCSGSSRRNVLDARTLRGRVCPREDRPDRQTDEHPHGGGSGIHNVQTVHALMC